MADRDVISKAEVLDIYAELYESAVWSTVLRWVRKKGEVGWMNYDWQ